MNINSKPKILIVDDEPFNVDYLEQELEDMDYDIITASNGREALDKVTNEPPDLILMDISLPVMDGYEATRQIRSTMKNTPIIGLSAHAMNGDVVRAKEAGCNDYLTKPLDEDLLLKKLKEYLG